MKKRNNWFVLGFFCLLSIVFFYQYFLRGLVPIPVNLLVSFYSPWRYETWPGFERGVPNKPIGTDIVKLFYPYRAFTTEQLKQGKIPLWNPYVFSGNVHAATYQSAIFYPLNIIYYLLPLVDAWSILVVIQPVLVGLCMYLFLRSLEISRKSSLFGSISLAFSGFFIAWWEESIVIQHSILWLPLALYGSNLLWKDSRLRGFLFLTTALTLSILAGFLQMSIYLFATVLIWNSYLWLIHKRKVDQTLAIIVLSFITAAMLTAVQWIPAFEAYIISPRGTVTATFLFERFLMPITHLVTFIAPDFWGNPGSYNYFFPNVFYHEKVIYMGIFPLIFILLGFLYCKGRAVNFWKVFSIVTLSLGFVLPTSWVWYTLHIPILSAVQPTRIFVLSTFGFSVLASYGLDEYLQKKEKRIIAVPLIIISVILSFLWAFVAGMWSVTNYQELMVKAFCHGRMLLSLPYICASLNQPNISQWTSQYATITLRNLFLPTFFVFAAWITLLLFRKKQRLLYGLIVGLTLLSAFYFSNKFLYFSFRQFVFPPVAPLTKLQELTKGTERIWGYGNAYIEKNMASYYHLYSPEGYDALYSREYGELLYGVTNNGVITSQIPRTDADLKVASERELMTDNPRRLRLLSLLGVKYILEAKLGENVTVASPEKRFPPSLFALAWENDRWRIWQYKDALPRAFFTSGYVVETNKQSVAEKIFDPLFDLQSLLVLEHEPIISSHSEKLLNKGIVTIQSYQPEKVVINVTAPTDGFVFLSDAYFPGWNALVDDHPVSLLKADYAFRAVAVPMGAHVVIFRYEPTSYILGIRISSAGFIFFSGLLFFIWRKNKENLR